jgi:Fe-S cluster assembly iron-binding protein IscA
MYASLEMRKEGGNMLRITDAATAHLARVLASTEAEKNEGDILRIIFEDNSLKLVTGKVERGDTTFKHEEATVLAVDEQVAAALSENTLDVEWSENKHKMVLL